MPTSLPETLSFRQEVRGFIDANLPAATREWMRLGHPATAQQTIEWHRTLNTRGWATPTWPREYGGAELSPTQRMILMDELFTAPAPEPHPQNSLMVGPLLIRSGTAEQKQRFLPRIASLEYWFCQGFSEPGAGSDLAAISTHAERDGDAYVVNGQKAWTSSAQLANWMFCLVRTDRQSKRQAGLSMLLIDMATPGVHVRPVKSLDGRPKLNEVFLDDVRVPASCRVGAEGEGWMLGRSLLGDERASIARVGRSRERLGHALRLIERLQSDGGDSSTIASMRERAADIDAELKALEITELRAVSGEASRRGTSDLFPSILKIRGAELMQQAEELAFDAAGRAALVRDDASGASDWAAALFPGLLLSRAGSIYGGSNEVQKNIVGKSLLAMTKA